MRGKEWLVDAFGLAFALLMVYGLIRWNEPAAYVVVGGIGLVLTLLLAAAPYIASRMRR
ncbi:MAG: hypothetical protein HY323_07370 [Betaproteobacteria bacterium]|nr:hypothetical protein [Betaproteobacteria bacterium]